MSSVSVDDGDVSGLWIWCLCVCDPVAEARSWILFRRRVEVGERGAKLTDLLGCEAARTGEERGEMVEADERDRVWWWVRPPRGSLVGAGEVEYEMGEQNS